MLRALADNRLNLLLIAAPISWVIHAIAPASPWVFITAAVSLVPLAGIIGLGTEQLAARSGPALGGFLNATFGNAAELIIATVALADGHVALVKASITGSIVGNLLLVLGLSFFVGGLGRKTQKFHRTAATNAAAMLFLAVVALVMPAVFDLALYGTLAVESAAIARLSVSSALVLIVAYAGSLVYAFTAHRDLFRSGHEPVDAKSLMPAASALALLAIGTVLTAIQAEILVGALQPALVQFGLTEMFVGVIVIAIIGNAAEHYSAVIAARRDQMTLAVEIAIGSSAQIALLVGPALVLYSYVLGHPMSLLFNAFEITAIALSVMATVIVVIDGESNWVEGLQLMAVYLILGLAFYFVPASS
ncbi:MAG: calcium/proton exchanger [Acidobacteria bacterium 13_1_40CM_4_65_8]|jgi:Ca2+:H+ antiporter|nr:MAG: calcium/proton exchanger [Acidobacteria bacterium 13_1_40CM_4_65_8]OLE82815.1 MAG: calcium/proton exchanger [Acidobacteria bacterium 13_1_20CM_2_65_9]